MLIDENSLHPNLFNLPDDRVAEQVLIPGFRNASRVRGAFGWFTAGWIERLAPGLAIYIERASSMPIEFTVAPALFPNERSAIERGVQMSADEASELVAKVFVDGRIEASALARHALDCLAWMVATNLLQLRIAVPTPDSNYHPKMWLFDDGVNQILARGSGNATGLGVSGGVEHLDVDVSWIPESRTRVTIGEKMLTEWSRGESLGISEVVDLPDALVRKIIQTAPSQPPKSMDYEEVIGLTGAAQRPMRQTRRLRVPGDVNWTSGTYAYQKEAVENWLGGDNPEMGVISMATGSGKTLTALICATHSQDMLNDEPFLLVISAPTKLLLMQWREIVEKFGITPVIPSLENNVDKALTQFFRSLRGGGTNVLIVTNILLCSESFQYTIEQKIRSSSKPISAMLIADEVHTLGAASFIQRKPEFFSKRLALSATPERQYDLEGTEQIFDFFGETVYEFGLGKAIGLCLTRYRYFVHASTLDDDEILRYERLSRQIGTAMASPENTDDNSLQLLLNARRKIIETGNSKIKLLEEVLRYRNPRDLLFTLIYVSAKNPQQFDAVKRVLTEMEIRWAPVTEQETAQPRRLAQTIEAFEKGSIQVLLAKKVLDEGFDVPSIREAFIVASSTVKREWVQRRGRVLRIHPEKRWAIIHDFLVFPPADRAKGENGRTLRKVVENELSRAYEFAMYADNVAGEHGVNSNLDEISSAYGLNNKAASSILATSGTQFVAPGLPRGKPW